MTGSAPTAVTASSLSPRSTPGDLRAQPRRDLDSKRAHAAAGAVHQNGLVRTHRPTTSQGQHRQRSGLRPAASTQPRPAGFRRKPLPADRRNRRTLRSRSPTGQPSPHPPPPPPRHRHRPRQPRRRCRSPGSDAGDPAGRPHHSPGSGTDAPPAAANPVVHQRRLHPDQCLTVAGHRSLDHLQTKVGGWAIPGLNDRSHPTPLPLVGRT